MKYKLAILAIVFCALLAVSAVSASDIANDDNAVQESSKDNIEISTAETVNDDSAKTSTAETVNEDTNVVEDAIEETIDPQATENIETLKANKDNEEKIGEGEGQYNTTDVNNYAELSGLFASGKMGRTSQNLTVNLLGDEEYIATKEIAIQTVSSDKLRNLIINGNGRVINGNDAYRFIKVGTYKGGVNLTINNLTIKNCYKSSGTGSAIYTSSSAYSNLTVDNVLFENNHQGEDGGAIGFYGVSLTITNSNFTGNYASYQAGAVYATIDNSGFLNVDNCIFTNNHANNEDMDDGNGGAIRFQNGQGTISNCKFTDNTAWDGGAIYAYDQDLTDENVCKLNIINCDFTQNTASGNGGGAVYNKAQVTATNSNFTSNSATNGADIYSKEDSVLEIENCNIDNDNIYKEEFSVVRNFKTTIPDEFSEGSQINIIVTESTDFSGTVKVLLGTEEVPIANFQNGGGSATVTPTLTPGTYNATLVYKESDMHDEKSILVKEFKVKRQLIKYTVLNNITGTVAIEIRVYDENGEEIISNDAVTLKIGDETIGTVKPFRVYKNTELTPENYTITAIFGEKTAEIKLTVEADPFAALNEAQEELNTANNKITELNNTLNQTKEDLNTATEKVDNLTAKVNELNATLNETEKALNTANEKAGNLTAQINQLNSNINALNNAINQAQSSLNSAAAQINNLNAQVKELKANNTSLQKSLNTVKAQNKKLNKIVSQIAVLKSLKSAKILKRTAKTYVITGTINKKLKGKKVIFVFKGKVYTRKTNSKGVAKLVLKQSLFKKFKKGKIVFSAIAGEKVITNTILVK